MARGPAHGVSTAVRTRRPSSSLLPRLLLEISRTLAGEPSASAEREQTEVDCELQHSEHAVVVVHTYTEVLRLSLDRSDVQDFPRLYVLRLQ